MRMSDLKTFVVIRFRLALENLALRQQLAVLERSGKRPNRHPYSRSMLLDTPSVLSFRNRSPMDGRHLFSNTQWGC